MSIGGPAIRATPHRLDCDAGAMTAAAAPAIGRRDGRFLQPPQGGWTFVGFAWIWGMGILLPLAGLVVFSFVSTRGVQFVFEPTLRAYYEIFAYSGWAVIQRSLRIAATITFLELTIAFPFAVWLAKGARSPRVKLVIFSLLVVPFFLSPASRTIVWRVVLGREGPVNSLLMALGIVDEPIDWLLFSEPAVHFGFIGPYFPSMVWPIFLSVSLIDDDILEASKDLGARPLDTLRHIIVPLAMPGILAGIIFTFVPLLGDTVVAQLVGGGNVLLLSASITNLITVMNYAAAAAMSVFVLALMLLLQFPLLWTLQRIGGVGEIFASLRR
jgi:spermidine/putrescine transport system permease protein